RWPVIKHWAFATANPSFGGLDIGRYTQSLSSRGWHSAPRDLSHSHLGTPFQTAPASHPPPMRNACALFCSWVLGLRRSARWTFAALPFTLQLFNSGASTGLPPTP